MLSHTAESFKRIGVLQIIFGVLSFLWQIGILVCTTQDNIYEVKKEYARDISYASTGFFAGIIFIISGFFSCRCCRMLDNPSLADPTTSIRISKGLDGVSIVFAILLEIFNAYLAYLTSHWYKEENLQTAKLAHAALPLHVLSCITGIAEIIVAVLELRLNPITKALPPVTYRAQRNGGMENPGYSASTEKII